MPDQTQELLTALGRLQQRYPHWRFGQLVSNVAAWAGTDRPGEVGEISDQDLLRAAQEHLARVDDRREGPQRAAI